MLLDNGPMFDQRGDNWCCLLCKRQFKTEQQLTKHISMSDLHSDNLAEATKAGRIRDPSNRVLADDGDAPPAEEDASSPDKDAPPPEREPLYLYHSSTP